MSAGADPVAPAAAWRSRLVALLVALTLPAACSRAPAESVAQAAPVAPIAQAAPVAPVAQVAQATPAAQVVASAVADGSGGELLFARGAPPNWELVVLDLASGEQRVLAATAGACEPAWSPDGTRLLFRAPHDGHWALATMAADGSDLRWLAPELSAYTAHWEPDGHGLITDAEPAPKSAPAPGAPAGSPGAGPMAIYRVAADGSVAPEKLADGHSPLLSPDGLWVIVRRSSDPVSLEVLHRPSGSLAPLTSAPDSTGAAFARAGDQFYFGRRLVSGARQIVGTTWPVIAWRQVTSGVADSLPTPSPDGRTLAFVRTTDAASAPAGAAQAAGAAAASRESNARDELFTRDLAAGTERHWPLDSVRRADETTLHEMQWSPDGTRLALSVGDGGLTAPRRLLLLDVRDGSVRECLDAAPGQVAWLAWRPSAAAPSREPAAPEAPGAPAAR